MRRLLPTLAAAALLAAMAIASAGGAAPASSIVGIVSPPDGNGPTFLARTSSRNTRAIAAVAAWGTKHQH